MRCDPKQPFYKGFGLSTNMEFSTLSLSRFGSFRWL